MVVSSALLAPLSAAAQGGPAPQAEIAVTPVIVHLSAADSAQATVVDVGNQGKVQAQLRFYLGDFEQRESGDYSYLPFGTGTHTCGQKLSAFPDGAVVGPGEHQAIQLRLLPGAGVCWAMLFVESQPQGRGAVRVIQRVAVKIMNAEPGATAGGDVTSVTATRLRGDTLRVRSVFRNTGEAPLDLRGRVEIRDYNGRVLAQTDFGPFGSLPGRNRIVDVSLLARLPRGDYVAVPIVDFGGDYLAGGQATFRVP